MSRMLNRRKTTRINAPPLPNVKTPAWTIMRRGSQTLFCALKTSYPPNPMEWAQNKLEQKSLIVKILEDKGPAINPWRERHFQSATQWDKQERNTRISLPTWASRFKSSAHNINHIQRVPRTTGTSSTQIETIQSSDKKSKMKSEYSTGT